MKTTIEIPDELLRKTKATAALRGESLKDFVTTAISERLMHIERAPPQQRGWRRVFGRARPEEVEEVDRIIADELGGINMDEWQ
jgi:hypothetical protein